MSNTTADYSARFCVDSDVYLVAIKYTQLCPSETGSCRFHGLQVLGLRDSTMPSLLQIWLPYLDIPK